MKGQCTYQGSDYRDLLFKYADKSLGDLSNRQARLCSAIEERMKLTISNEDRGRIGCFLNGYCFSLDLIGDGE